MSVIQDPDNLEMPIILDFAGNLDDKTVLEIGCGDGRLTEWLARQAAHVVAIDPNQEKIESARGQLPADLKEKVEYRAVGMEEFRPERRFDLALVSWSL